MRAPRWWLAPLLGLVVLLTGCISEEQEQTLGDQMAGDINTQLPLVRDPLLNGYLASLGDTLAQVSERPGLKYRFYIINSGTVNAFALPGGHIYVTRGLIERTRNAGELAGVLAHEIGHVAARHGVEKLQRHLRTGSLVNVMYRLILGGEPSLLQQNSLQMAGVLWSASHSREDEREADALAVEYLVRAGIHPRGVVSLLQTLLTEEGQSPGGGAAAWFSSHPMTAERITHAEAEIVEELKENPRKPQRKYTSYPAFLRRVAALPPPADAPALHP